MFSLSAAYGFRDYSNMQYANVYVTQHHVQSKLRYVVLPLELIDHSQDIDMAWLNLNR